MGHIGACLIADKLIALLGEVELILHVSQIQEVDEQVADDGGIGVALTVGLLRVTDGGIVRIAGIVLTVVHADRNDKGLCGTDVLLKALDDAVKRSGIIGRGGADIAVRLTLEPHDVGVSDLHIGVAVCIFLCDEILGTVDARNGIGIGRAIGVKDADLLPALGAGNAHDGGIRDRVVGLTEGGNHRAGLGGFRDAARFIIFVHAEGLCKVIELGGVGDRTELVRVTLCNLRGGSGIAAACHVRLTDKENEVDACTLIGRTFAGILAAGGAFITVITAGRGHGVVTGRIASHQERAEGHRQKKCRNKHQDKPFFHRISSFFLILRCQEIPRQPLVPIIAHPRRFVNESRRPSNKKVLADASAFSGEGRGIRSCLLRSISLLIVVMLRKRLRSPFKNAPPEPFFTAFESRLIALQKNNTLSGAVFFGASRGIRTPVRFLPNGFQEDNQRIPFPLSSVQFVLKRFAKILIPQGFSGLFGTDLNQNELIGIDMN